MRTISTSTPTARKVHDDDCAEWLLNSDLTGDLTFTERRAIVYANRRNWKITPGMKYVRVTNLEDDGTLYTFKGAPELIDICRRVGLWDNL